MSTIQEKEPKEDERKIPVLTVTKNGVILKNIFVINNPPSPELDFIDNVENLENPDGEIEEILIVGRHPDCHIVLMHPSISRFHLQINSKPSAQKLFVTDLSSVHGTWVSEKKIEPGFRVELHEGDTIKVGGSTRVYRLHWIPLSCAYDMENPFVSSSDMAMIEEKKVERVEKLSQDQDLLATENGNAEEKDSSVVQEKAEETHQEMNPFSTGNGEIQSVDSIFEGVNSLFSYENSGLVVKKEIPSAPLMPENINSSLCDENEEIGLPRIDPSILKAAEEVILQSLNQQFCECNQSPDYYSAKESLLEKENTDISIRLELESNVGVNSDSSSSSLKEAKDNSVSEMPEETENQSLLRKNIEQMDIFPLEFINLSLSLGDLSHANNEQVNQENRTPEPLAALSLLYEEENRENSTKNQTLDELVSPQIICAYDPAATEALDEMENQSPSRKDYGGSGFSEPIATESVNSSLPLGEVLSEIVESKQSLTPQSAFPAFENLENSRSPPIGSAKKSSSYDLRSRTGKPATALQLHTSKSGGRIRRLDVDADVEWENQENIESKSITRALFPGLEAMDEEIFTPDKENHTPNTSLLKLLKKKGKLEDSQLSKSCRSSSPKIAFSPSIGPEEDMIVSSDKENQTPKVFQQRKSARLTSRNQVKLEEDMVLKERKIERIPFQSLLANSPGKSISEVSAPSGAARLDRVPFQSLLASSPIKSISECSAPSGAARLDRVPFQSLLASSPIKSISECSVTSAAAGSSNSINCTQKNVTSSTSINSVGDGKRRWTLIADATSLLDKESMKSLQLLQGLKGTHLIIPIMAIRELDSLNRRGSMFRRTTEASLVLKWIEECMVKTKWWIHVQSSVEDARPIAPTPPASPVSRFSDGSVFPCRTTSSVSFSTYGSLLEIASPTAEDHILDYALANRKMNNDGQLVLLSNNVTLKIKAMAEGLICETAQEFRDSLVNPFSERFLWADSSPRGQTWSVFDDVVLKEKYYRSPSKKSSKGEGVKGLKLILLHNSHYGQLSQSIH